MVRLGSHRSPAFIGEWIALANDPDRRTRMGESARRRARTFSWETAAKELETLMMQMLSERG